MFGTTITIWMMLLDKAVRSLLDMVWTMDILIKTLKFHVWSIKLLAKRISDKF